MMIMRGPRAGTIELDWPLTRRSGPTLPDPAPDDRPEPAELNDVEGEVLAGLRELLDRAQRGDLELTMAGPASLAASVTRDAVRLTLIVEFPATGHGLSPRELQIARLVAGGATNHAIARSLDISPWTVSTHLRRVFAKLGVGTRAEMVAQLFGAAALLPRG
jgi:DNA-binding CsgD family transcriptional regulator